MALSFAFSLLFGPEGLWIHDGPLAKIHQKNALALTDWSAFVQAEKAGM